MGKDFDAIKEAYIKNTENSQKKAKTIYTSVINELIQRALTGVKLRVETSEINYETSRILVHLLELENINTEIRLVNNNHADEYTVIASIDTKELSKSLSK